MGRPRKSPIPLEAEAREFLIQKKTPERVLTTKDYVAIAVFTGLLSRSSGMIRGEDLRELKRAAYEYAEAFLED